MRFLIRELREASGEVLKETDVVLLCFSLETSVSLARVVSHWSVVTSSAPLLLVGTKSDARQAQAVSYQQAQAVASADAVQPAVLASPASRLALGGSIGYMDGA